MIPLRDDNPTTLTPFVTVVLIASCVVVFLWQIAHNEVTQQLIVYALGVIPAVLLEGAMVPEEIAWVPPGMTIVTSMFLHGGWGHLLGNMLYLWIFGNNVEDSMGHFRFILFYLICGVVAVFAQALPNPESEIPMVGASGAISGVLGAYLLLHPHARVLVLIPIGFILQAFEVKAVWVLGLWFVMQLFSSMLSATGEGGVAFGAHIGGFVAGMALIPLFKHKGIRLQNPFGSHPSQ
jgi:membrane associated rhomboid family serine protease